MGSHLIALAPVAPQQLLPPLFTRRAAWPYFSFTISLTSELDMFLLTSSPDVRGYTFCIQPAIPATRLCAYLHNFLRLYCLIASTALRVQKLQQLAQCFGI